MDKNMKEKEAQTKLGNAVMQALIKVTALEKAVLQKGILTEDELAEALAFVVSDVVETMEKEGVKIDFKEASDKGE